MSNTVEAAELHLSIAAQDKQQLVLRYEVRNAASDRIYLFEPLLRWGANAAPVRDVEGAHVFLEGNYTARIARGLIAPPAYMSVGRRPPIVVTMVGPGAAHAGTIRLDLPLMERNPYFPPQTACDPRSAHSIVELKMQLGWVEARPGMALSEATIDGAKLMRLSGGWGTPLQRVMEATIPVSGVALCPYPGQFDRPALTQ